VRGTTTARARGPSPSDADRAHLSLDATGPGESLRRSRDLDALEVGGVQHDDRRGDVLPEAGPAAGPGDRHDVLTAGEKPGQGELRSRDARLRRDGLHLASRGRRRRRPAAAGARRMRCSRTPGSCRPVGSRRPGSRCRTSSRGRPPHAEPGFRHHRLLVGVRALPVGGVQQRDTKVERAVQRGDGLSVVTGTVERAHAHAAKAEGADLQGTGTAVGRLMKGPLPWWGLGRQLLRATR